MIKNIFFGDNNYGFSKTPTNKNFKTIDFPKSWYVTSSYNSALNHCAAVTSANLENYFFMKNSISPIVDPFDKHHDRIGNGPVVKFSRKTKKLLKHQSIEVFSKTKIFCKFNHIKKSIDSNNPLTLLLCHAPFNWHWVICVGYSEENGKLELQIIDNWTISYSYYLPNDKSILVCATKYFQK